jgi:hypothetical protein
MCDLQQGLANRSLDCVGRAVLLAVEGHSDPEQRRASLVSTEPQRPDVCHLAVPYNDLSQPRPLTSLQRPHRRCCGHGRCCSWCAPLLPAAARGPEGRAAAPMGSAPIKLPNEVLGGLPRRRWRTQIAQAGWGGAGVAWWRILWVFCIGVNASNAAEAACVLVFRAIGRQTKRWALASHTGSFACRSRIEKTSLASIDSFAPLSSHPLCVPAPCLIVAQHSQPPNTSRQPSAQGSLAALPTVNATGYRPEDSNAFTARCTARTQQHAAATRPGAHRPQQPQRHGSWWCRRSRAAPAGAARHRNGGCEERWPCRHWRQRQEPARVVEHAARLGRRGLVRRPAT